MRFNPRARLDRGQVRNRRGGGGGGGGRGMGVGGGIGGVIVLVVIVLLNSGILGNGPAPGPGPRSDDGPVSTGGGEPFWSRTLPRQADVQYADVDTLFFSDRVDTGCGAASSSVGPFYCPVDKLVYLDTTFFQDMQQQQLGGSGGDFAEAYVLAHEYGHHVQDLLGTMGRVRTQQGAARDAVRLELQADCYAGMWARRATEAGDARGRVFIQQLTHDDIAEALDAARAVGDDRIQRRSSGRVDPDAWTHGSAQQRMRWFTTGRTSGTLRACDTFGASRL